MIYTLPCFATITLDTASGTLVPAAKNVIPITESGIFRVSPVKKECKNNYIFSELYSTIDIHLQFIIVYY